MKVIGFLFFEFVIFFGFSMLSASSLSEKTYFPSSVDRPCVSLTCTIDISLVNVGGVTRQEVERIVFSNELISKNPTLDRLESLVFQGRALLMGDVLIDSKNQSYLYVSKLYYSMDFVFSRDYFLSLPNFEAQCPRVRAGYSVELNRLNSHEKFRVSTLYTALISPFDEVLYNSALNSCEGELVISGNYPTLGWLDVYGALVSF